jgi:DNA-binding IclR family transcriptional regulator
MAITPDYLREASEVVTAAASVREAAATWRTRDPAMRVVVVDAMDMRDETPAMTLGQRRVFLATSNGHCWTTTQQAAEATALILTQE